MHTTTSSSTTPGRRRIGAGFTALLAALSLAGVATLLAALAVVGMAAPAAGAEASQRTLEAEARRATARYHDVDRAIADGYVPVSPCTEEPGAGAMGIHYLRPDLVDDVIDVTEPELLLYVPAGDRMRLVGVEYMVPADDQDPGDGLDAADRPWLGEVAFDGPMLGHAPGDPVHFDLHVWVWDSNPDGLYAHWNPSLTCPSA